jgi:PAS domain S-box-containing protein
LKVKNGKRTLLPKPDILKAGFRNIVDQNADGIVVVSERGVILFANRAAEALFHCGIEALAGESFFSPLATGEHQELEITLEDGTRVIAAIRVAGIFWGGEKAYVVSLRDITEHKLAEIALKEHQERYRIMVENITDVIWTVQVDSPTRLTYVSPSITRLLGYSVEEAMTMKMEEVFAPDSFDTAMKALAEELDMELTGQKDPNQSHTLEFELKHKDGSPVHVEINASFLRIQDGQPIEILTIARDITSRKHAQDRLIKSETRFRSALDNMLEGCQVIGYDWRYITSMMRPPYRLGSPRGNSRGAPLWKFTQVLKILRFLPTFSAA